MKKVLFGIVGLVLVLVAAVLIVPGMIDWNAYKAEIAAQAKAATGRDLVIDGDIRITVLPAPALVAGNVRLANIKSASAPDMIHLKSLEVRIAPGPLLGGRVEVQTIKLVEPRIELEVLADGRRNWDFTLRDENKPAAAAATTGQAPAPAAPATGTPPAAPAKGAAPAGPAVRLDSFVIEKGSLVYRDAKGGTVERVDGINAEIAAASLSGPFDSTGRLTVRGYPLTYEVSIGQIIHGRTVPFSLTLGLTQGGAKVQSAGTLVSLGEAPKFKGTVKVEGNRLADLIHVFAAPGPLPGFLAQPFSVEGAVVASAAGAEVKDLAIGLGEVRGNGEISATLDGVPNIAARINVNRVDVDAWLAMPAAAAAPGPKGAGGARTAGGGVAAPVPPAPTAKASGDTPPAPFAFPKDINASLKFVTDVLTYRGKVVREARVNAELAAGEVTLSQLSAQLPGSSSVAVFGVVTAEANRPRFEGEAEVSVSDFRAVLGWLGNDIPGVPSGRLRRLTMVGKLTATPAQLQATDVDVHVDSSRITGGVTVALQGRPSFGANVTIDRLNLDAYLPGSKSAADPPPPRPGAGKPSPPAKTPAKAPAQQPSAPAATAPNPLAGIAVLRAFDANVKAHVKTLVYHETSIRDVVLDATLFDDKITVRRASVGKLAGVSALVSGTLAGLGGIPEMKDVRFEAGGDDLSRLFALTRIELPFPPKNLGTVAIKGSASGSVLKPVLDVSLRAAQAQVGAKGTVALVPPRLDLTVTARHKDVARLVRALGVDYRPAGKVGGLDVSAAVKGDPSLLFLSDIKGTVGDVPVAGKVTVGLDRPKPWFTADLDTGAIVVDRFLPAKRTAALHDLRHALLPARRPDTAVLPAAWRGPAPGAGVPLRRVAAKAAGGDRWSRDPIDLSALRLANADVKLRAQAVSFEAYRLESADLALALSDGILQANRLTGVLYGGRLDAKAAVRGAQVPVVETTVALKGMDVDKAGRAVTGKPLAGGTMDLDLKLSAAGRSVAALVAALQGNGAFALRRLDVEAGGKGTAMAAALNLVAGLNQLGAGAAGRKKGQGLADVTGTFTVERGIARSTDLKLLSGLGDGQATGTVDLPNWVVDVAGELTLSKSLAGQILATTTKADPASQVVPFHVKGPLDAPNVKLDTSKLQGGIKIPGVDKLLKKKGVGPILQQLLPGQSSKTPQAAPAPGALPPPGAAPLPPPPPAGATAPSAAAPVAPVPPAPGAAPQAPAPAAPLPPAEPQKVKPRDLLKGLLKGLGG